VSLDSGLVFERELAAGGRAAVQTLEPRLYFLYVPYRDQERLIVDENDDAVVFDSAAYGFSLGSLFRDNRYSGADRVGDARQISLALTSRLLDAQGRELLNASVGRAYYLRDRLVTLPGAAVETDAASDWLASLTSQWTPALSARATLLWDAQADATAQGTFDVRYLQDRQRVLRLGYRYTQDAQEQVDVAGLWPLTDRWGVAGRWLHSLRDGITLETLAGIEYQSCCWNLRLVQQRFRDSVTAPDFDSVLWLQLELKGLASVGDRVDQRLARDILAP
jgi:LPS-assembly protein